MPLSPDRTGSLKPTVSDNRSEALDLAEPAGRGGLLLVVGAAVLWSTSGLFAKAPIFEGWDPAARGPLMAFWRAVFALLIVLPLVRRPAWSWRLVPMMVCFAAMSWCFLQALILAEAATAIWLQYSAPLFVLAGSALIFRERVTARDIIFALVSLSGVALILIGQVGGATTAGLMYGVLSGLFYAGVILTLRQLREFDSGWLVFLNQAATIVIMLPLIVWYQAVPVGQQWFWLIAFGVFQLGMPYLLFARGLRVMTSHEASLVVLLEPVLVPVWVWLAWRHHAEYQAPTSTTLIGALIILASLILRYSGVLKRKPRTAEADTATGSS